MNFKEWVSNSFTRNLDVVERNIAQEAWNAALDNQWQDIETAPKDETRISLWTKETDSPKQGELKEDWLLYRNRWIPIAVFDEDMGWCELIGGTWYQIKERVTHWQPRPRPPSKEKS